jgi:hypothetical protein
MAVSGNPQLNVRLEPDLMRKVKEEAEKQGMRPQEWVRRLIKETLGEVPNTVVLSNDGGNDSSVSRGEFEAVISTLNGKLANAIEEIDQLKKPELVA